MSAEAAQWCDHLTYRRPCSPPLKLRVESLWVFMRYWLSQTQGNTVNLMFRKCPFLFYAFLWRESTTSSYFMLSFGGSQRQVMLSRALVQSRSFESKISAALAQKRLLIFALKFT